jgi:ABC-2 type transport system permease protein
MNTTYLATEVRRTLRAPRYFIFVIGMPVALFLLFSSLYGTGTQDGVAAKAWLMVSMSVFGAMGAAVSIGGRIAGERQAGWTRQLRLTPMPGRMYVASKAVTALAVAVPALALVYAVGAVVEGVRLPASDWALAAGWSLLALVPFVAMGIWLGHRLTVDVLGPLSGALFTGLGVLGGVWFPVDQLPSAMQGLAKALPSYWLAQAGREPLAGSWIGWHGVSVLAVWTVVFAVLGARAYQRDTARA